MAGYRSAFCLAAALALAGCSSLRAQEYDIGGPLAGYKLPLFPTQQGEAPGHPGDLPGLYDKDPLQPIFELNPGSIEQYRTYWHKYLPTRSFFDRQSRIKAWQAPNLPGADARQAEEYAAPLYYVPRYAAITRTDRSWKPVPVIRCKPGDPAIRLDLGELNTGLYALRLIGAVPTGQLRPFREPLIVRMTVNDGLHGETSAYRLRCGYVDEIYSIIEIYFHATEKRRYRAELTVEPESKVDMLLHEVSLDDALAGTDPRECKVRTTISDVKPPESKVAPLAKDARFKRDAAIWENFPLDNMQSAQFGISGDEHDFTADVKIGLPDKTPKEIDAEFGAWTSGGADSFMVNNKLKLSYTTADLRQGKPLPDPYPFKDNGLGIFIPDPKAPSKGCIWAPVAQEVENRFRNYPGDLVHKNVDTYLMTGDANAAHDAAIALARFAYAFPTIDYGNSFFVAIARDPSLYGREYHSRRRETTAVFYPWYTQYVDPILFDYDRLFDFIKDNQPLAESIGRFVPWVKTPQDVTRLIDVYLVQTTAKRILRYHYYTDPLDIANTAAVLGAPKLTGPWMEWLFSKTFVYPSPPTGIQDLLVTSHGRDGCQYIGSTYYAQGESAERIMAPIEMYLSAGGDPKYALTDHAKYPKADAHCYWRIKNVVAGGDFTRVGDVTGPDKTPGYTLVDLGFATNGWRWTKDPKFAFILKNYVGRKSATGHDLWNDAEWAEIAKAADAVKRAPWLDNRSRVMPMWAGVLESGLDQNDPRLRSAAYLRLGFGWGHQHSDSLDLQVVAQGVMATIDGGQRNGYSRPADSTTRVHNLVEVDKAGLLSYSWARAISDAPGARYLRAEVVPPQNVSLMQRQIALIDADPGKPGGPISIAAQWPNHVKLPEGAVPANAYVFDVFRVAGGKTHTYCFHGTVEDDFQWNAADVQPAQPASEAGQYLKSFGNIPDTRFVGKAPDTLEATWRMNRDKSFGAQKYQYGPNYSNELPPRFTRLHLLGVRDAAAMRASVDCFNYKYNWTCLMVQKTTTAETMDSAFVAFVEPYLGQPFITSTRLLAVPDNEADAQRAVAAEVATTNGRQDLCFADGRPEKVRSFRNPQSAFRISAEFAFYSADKEGLRQASLTGGTLLEAPGITIQPAARERTGTVVKADYLAKTIWIDQPWPAREGAAVFEIGSPGRMTTCTALHVAPEAAGARLSLEGGADYFQSKIVSVAPQEGKVVCGLMPPLGARPGVDRNWVASNEDQTLFWRADIADEKARAFKLTGPPMTVDSFGKQNLLRLWEYGVGDRVRQSTSASVRRLGPGLYELAADVDVTITLSGASVEISPDTTTWKSLNGRKAQGKVTVAFSAADLGPAGLVYLRVK